jgi:HEAT repeat protein
MFALSCLLLVMGGCSFYECVPPGCDTCDEPPVCTGADPCGPPACWPADCDTRPSTDYLADLRANDRSARERAIEALARRGPSVLPEVEPLLSDPDPAVRYSALAVLVRLREHAWPSVFTVKQRLSDPDPAIRADAAYVIGMSGSAGADAIPELRAALCDWSPYVRYRAAVAFQKLDTVAEPALPSLERASRCDRDPRVREAAKCAIWRIQRAACGRSS